MQITREATCKLAPSLFLPFVYRPDSKYLASLLCSSVCGSRAFAMWQCPLAYYPAASCDLPTFPPQSLGEVRARLSLFFQVLGWNPGWPRVTHPASLRPDLDCRPQLLFPLPLSLVHLPGESLEGLQDLALSAQHILQVKEPFPWVWGREIA